VACKRLMSVPGVGPVISSAMVAAIGSGDVFSKGRDFGAWLGLVPKQISTAGGISKRGSRVSHCDPPPRRMVGRTNCPSDGISNHGGPAENGRSHHNLGRPPVCSYSAGVAAAGAARLSQGSLTAQVADCHSRSCTHKPGVSLGVGAAKDRAPAKGTGGSLGIAPSWTGFVSGRNQIALQASVKG
jgi:hypothetical protein